MSGQSPAARVLDFALYAYQERPRVAPPRCRFIPSCSEYARDAIVVHGATKGALLGAARVARCHPFAAGGLDPVPPRRAAATNGKAAP